MKTFMASEATIDRKWYVVDAAGMTLGRLASEVAKVLRGKNKPIFTPHMDTGDYVIIVNAEKIQVTGKKLDQKIYYHHSDYVGGMKQTTLKEKLADSAVFAFTAEDWGPPASWVPEAPAEGEEPEAYDGSLGYEITIPAEAHKRKSGDFGFHVFHQVEGKYVTNTWAALGTGADYDGASKAITLRR